MRKLVPAVISIFILPPSKTELERRLNSRGQDSAEVIKGRMEKAQSEMSHYNEYDYLLRKYDSEQTLSHFEQIVLANRQQLANQQVKFDNLITELLAN